MTKKTIREAILQSLEDLRKPSKHTDILSHIVKESYYSFDKGKTPEATISAQLGDFIRRGDVRVKRIKQGKGFNYYLTKFEGALDEFEIDSLPKASTKQVKNYDERSLHKLLASYLNQKDIFSKTIYHEKSKNSKDKYQKWIHPDMIGINFVKLDTAAAISLFKTVNIGDSFQLSSYEIKKTINTDYELKEVYFQAVSNSSWANYGYLVALEISSSLNDEMERLNQSFGIGIIELKANPFESKVLFPAKLQNLDYVTIDKLSKVNKDFAKFIEESEKMLTADVKYVEATKSLFLEFCDEFFTKDEEIEEYCNKQSIPLEKVTES